MDNEEAWHAHGSPSKWSWWPGGVTNCGPGLVDLRGCTIPHLRHLAIAIDDAFARWDRSHLHEFKLTDGRRLGFPSDDDWEPENVLDYRKLRLSRLAPGEQFAYTFDLGDDWQHLCTVGPGRIDPLETLGIVPDRPLPF